MPSAMPVIQTDLPTLPRFRTGKVRDVYDLGDTLLLVATDRISAFDYVLGTGIPDKGKVLTQLSAFWFDKLADVVPNHFLTLDVTGFPQAAQPYAEVLRGRTMLTKKTRPIDIECVARGYLSGSGWKEYRESGTVCGIALPAGPERIGPPARADLHAGDQGRQRARHQHRRSRGHAPAGRRRAVCPPARAHPRAVRPGRRPTPSRAGSSWPTPSSSSVSTATRCCSSTRR